MQMLHNFRHHFYFDHYLGKHADFPVNGAALLRLDEISRPRILAHVALWIDARVFLDRQLPFPSDTPLVTVFLPVQLRRFLRGFVDAAAEKLVGKDHSTPSYWIQCKKRMCYRVIGGYFSSVEVRERPRVF
jgi:hypothetical protein